MSVELGVLGPLEIRADGVPVRLGMTALGDRVAATLNDLALV